MTESDWKKIQVEFSGGPLIISVPADCAELTMKKAEVLKNPADEIVKAYERPWGGLTLDEIIRRKEKEANRLQAAIAVSDVTRPVPYKGEAGILPPLLKKLQKLGLRRENIRIIVGTGTHRASTAQEKGVMFGKDIVSSYTILDHDCQDESSLLYAGRTPAGTDIYVNRCFYEADLKLITGLTESHFMAGASGGRKAVCPALVDLRTIQKFHSPEFLESPYATNLVLTGNPCHEEAQVVAQTVGVDFAVTVTMDKNMRLTGVFAGELKTILERAVERIKSYVTIPLDEEFDMVLTHGGYVGRNHYQTAKAAVGSIPAVKQKGVVIIAADNRDDEPIGSPEYKTLSHLLKLQGPNEYVNILRSPSWRFTKDQWEPEVWGHLLRKVGEEGLIYCSPDIPEEAFSRLPGVSGYTFLSAASKGKERVRKVEEMVQNAIVHFYRRYREKGISPRLAFICEGPYAVPFKTRSD
jgi:nickel-dependent lactate racemase